MPVQVWVEALKDGVRSRLSRMMTVYQIVSRRPFESVAVSCTRPRNVAVGVPDITAVEESTTTPSGSQLVE